MASKQNSSIITEEMKKMIGLESEPVSLAVEKGAIQRVLRALQDTNPIWKELEAAKIGSEVIVPPAYLMSVSPKGPDVKIEGPQKKNVAGGEEWQFFSPIKLTIGKTISAKRRLSDIVEKQGKSGPMILIILEDSYQSEEGELLALHRNTLIRM